LIHDSSTAAEAVDCDVKGTLASKNTRARGGWQNSAWFGTCFSQGSGGSLPEMAEFLIWNSGASCFNDQAPRACRAEEE